MVMGRIFLKYRENSDTHSSETAPETSGKSEDSIRTETLVWIHRLTQRKILEALTEEYGEKEVLKLLYETGFATGGKLVCDALCQGADFWRFAMSLQKDLADQRIGIVRVESFDPDTPAGWCWS
jgi:hypothetical protein